LASGIKKEDFDKRLENLNQILNVEQLWSNSIISIIMGDMNFRNQSSFTDAMIMID